MVFDDTSSSWIFIFQLSAYFVQAESTFFKYPKSAFKGTVAEIARIDFKTDGTYPVSVSGDLTLHGVTNKVSTKGKIIIKGGKITGSSVFTVTLEDYKIVIPKLVENNISKTIDITVNCLYDQKM